MAKGNSLRRIKAFTLPFAPANRLEANRWLNMATFGPATARVNLATATKTALTYLPGEEDDADKLMRIGYVAYMNEQMSDNSIIGCNDAHDIGHSLINSAGRSFNYWWFANAIHSSAAVRFKTAFALSQIFAAKRQPGIPDKEERRYYDFLLNATLSTNTNSFRKLLDDVTYSHIMAVWLTYILNKKEDVATSQQPDENYAREILQLFTLGLTQLNLDGTPILDEFGVPKPTYVKSDITNLAKVFTGIGGGELLAANATGRLTQNPSNHDLTAKTLLAYHDGSQLTIPAKTLTNLTGFFETRISPTGYAISNVTANTFQITKSDPTELLVAGGTDSGGPFAFRLSADINSTMYTCTIDGPSGAGSHVRTLARNGHGLSNGTVIYPVCFIQEDIKLALDWISNHPTVAPFISKALIKLMVCSNPTPQYVKRVATVFNNNGNGVYGDLSAVVKAIFLDAEAILPYGINPNNFGKFQTVLDKTLRTLRALRSESVGYQKESNHEGPSLKDLRLPVAVTKPTSVKDYSSFAFFATGSIMPMQTPSVFNFYRPGFTPPGTVLGELGLTSPEMQLLNLDSQITWANLVSSACDTWESSTNGGAFPTASNESVDHRTMDYTEFGLDFNPHPDGWTVTSVTGSAGNWQIEATGTLNATFVHNRQFSPMSVYFVVRTKANRVQCRFRSASVVEFKNGPNNGYSPVVGTQAQTIKLLVEIPLIEVGDVIDVASMIIRGRAGMGSQRSVDDNNFGSFLPNKGNNLFYHKVAGLTPNGSATPTEAELTPAINHIESVLLNRPMSAALKAIVVQAGQVPVTDATTSPVFTVTGAAANHYLNLIMTRAQKRARHMMAMVLVSPEYSTIR